MGNLKIIKENIIFAIVEQQKFNFYIQMFDMFEKLIYEKLISTELNYAIDID